jgi:F0F1-type ATP synthase assembly protein I
MSISWAEFISTWSNWVLIVALIVGVLATYGIVVSGNVKETELKRQLGEAGAVAETAKADATKLAVELEQAKTTQSK